MNFTVSKNGYTEKLWNSSERITTPSIVCSKNGSTFYIPLFNGDKTYKYYLHIIMNVPNNPGGTL